MMKEYSAGRRCFTLAAVSSVVISPFPSANSSNELSQRLHRLPRFEDWPKQSNFGNVCCVAERERRIDECLPRIGISSCDEFLGDRVLQVLVWVVGVICLLTNALVI